MPSKSKNVLVTGGAGYIGSHVVEALIKRRFNIDSGDNRIMQAECFFEIRNVMRNIPFPVDFLIVKQAIVVLNAVQSSYRG